MAVSFNEASLAGLLAEAASRVQALPGSRESATAAWTKPKIQNNVSRMKIRHLYLALVLVGLAGCTTTTTTTNSQGTTVVVHPHSKGTLDTPETVVVTYHVRSGMEAAFPALLARAWGIYRKEHMVKSEPHVIVREREDDGKMRYVEIFTWVSHSAPDHAPPDVVGIWNQEISTCEGRNGHQPLEGGEVELILPRIGGTSTPGF